MKTGRALPDLLKEVMRQAETKRDFVVDTRAIQVTDKLDMDFGDQHLGIGKIAHEQISEHTKIPKAYYDRMKDEAPELLANNINTWFRKFPAPRMVRTLDNRARSMHSDRYRSLDNFDLCEAVLPPLIDRGIEVMSSEITESRLYLKVVDQRIIRDLPSGWSPHNRGHDRFTTVSPALVISNSEVGKGSLSVLTSVWFGGCTNLTVMNEGSVRKYHVGSKQDLIGEEVYRMLSDDTKKLNDAAVWATIRDVAGAAFDQAQFDATIARLKPATEDVIDVDPVKVIEVTAKRFGLTDGERGAVLRHLIQDGDLSRFGVHNAITRTAQDAADYDRASELEKLGGVVVELPRNEWTSIISEAGKLKEAA